MCYFQRALFLLTLTFVHVYGVVQERDVLSRRLRKPAMSLDAWARQDDPLIPLNLIDARVGTRHDSSGRSSDNGLLAHTFGNESQAQMDKLLNDKLRGAYEKLARPFPDCSWFDCTHRIKITMGLSFKKLLSLDQTTGTLSMVISVRLNWPDYRLVYNATEYFAHVPAFGKGRDFVWNSNTDFVPVDYNKIWLPDIQVLDATREPQPINHERRVFWFDGEKLRSVGYNMVMESPELVHVSCPMSLKRFPFDTQVCHLKFGDWSASERYFVFDTNIHGEYMWDMPEHSEEFRCTKIEVDRERKEYHVDDRAKFPLVDYTLHLQRYPQYYILQYVLPYSVLVLIGQGIYWMTLDRERHSTAITTVLAVMTVSFLTAPILPESNEVMWVEFFQIGCYILTCLPVFVSQLLDQSVSVGILSDAWAARVDPVARVVHPLFVLAFYLFAFHDVELPISLLHSLPLSIFIGFNVIVFSVFFLSGLWALFQFEKESQGDVKQQQEVSGISVTELRKAVDALHRALAKTTV